MNKVRRKYTERTLKILFALSGNRCPYPNCPHALVEDGSFDSLAALAGQISHIHSASNKGPRKNPGLSAKERNEPENLIVFCAHHHQIIDKQEKKYPTALLKEWKAKHEAAAKPGTLENIARQNLVQRAGFYQRASDEKIDLELTRIRRGRFFAGFNALETTERFAKQVETGEWCEGSPAVRAKALAWSARFLAVEAPARAHALLAMAKSSDKCEATEIAEAFTIADENLEQALQKLRLIDSPTARSAALLLVTRIGGADAGLKWARKLGLGPSDFDPDGKNSLLHSLLRESRWDEAIASLAQIYESDFLETPILLNTAGFTYLIQAVAEDLRQYVMVQVPFEAAETPLSSEPNAIIAQRRAIEMFERASLAGQELGVAAVSNPASDYALWLRLKDSKTRDAARKELQENLNDPGRYLRRVNLAVRFNVSFDTAAVEAEIDRDVAFDGSGTADAAAARIALAFTHKEGIADYIAKHRQLLHKHLNKPRIQALEIEVLAGVGDLKAAKKKLREYAKDGLGKDEQRRLERIFKEASGEDPVEQRQQAFSESNLTSDLINLVRVLHDRGNWQVLSEFAAELFGRTKDINDATIYARSLLETRRHKDLIALLASRDDLLKESAVLREMIAWAYYRSGSFLEAAEHLSMLRALRESSNDRKLALQIAIASGRWGDLIEITNQHWEQRDRRSPEELLLAGQLGQFVGAPHGRDLIREAARRAPKDPNVLVGAYAHAVAGGWERDEAVHEWLAAGARLSKKDGPIKKMSLKQVAKLQPKWNKTEENALQTWNTGAAPAFMVAEQLRRSLLDLYLGTGISNLQEDDTRRRGIVYAFSGNRGASNLPTKAKRIALDVTAIFTLWQTGLLNRAIAAYEHVLIPHSTLGWLLQEHQLSAFHQPSQIKQAQDLERLVAAKKITVLKVAPVADSALLREVGRDLAGLIEAAISPDASRRKRYVVRSNPVHRAGSLTGEMADLSKYRTILRSCQFVVRKLRARGSLTKRDAEHATSYLELHEKAWPKEPAIGQAADLYLDGLSVSYFQATGLMEKLGGKGLTFFVPETEVSKARQLIAVGHLSERRADAIQSIRHSLMKAIESSRVSAAAEVAQMEERDGFDHSHPTVSIFDIGEEVEAIIVDDRFVNQHQNMEQAQRKVPIATSLDLIDDLVTRGVISAEECFAARTELRRAGYHLIPLRIDELGHHIENVDGQDFVESAELRAIRESFLRLKMANGLQFPNELPWLNLSVAAAMMTIKDLWAGKGNNKRAERYSHWLLDLIDPRGWSPAVGKGNEKEFALFAYPAQLMPFIGLENAIQPARRKFCSAWFDNLMQTIESAEPEMFSWICQRASEAARSFVQRRMENLK